MTHQRTRTSRHAVYEIPHGRPLYCADRKVRHCRKQQPPFAEYEALQNAMTSSIQRASAKLEGSRLPPPRENADGVRSTTISVLEQILGCQGDTPYDLPAYKRCGENHLPLPGVELVDLESNHQLPAHSPKRERDREPCNSLCANAAHCKDINVVQVCSGLQNAMTSSRERAHFSRKESRGLPHREVTDG